MLSVNDYNHLKLLYDKFFKSNAHIANLINQGDWESVDVAIQEKENIIRQIIFFEKPRLEQVKSNDELMALRNKLVELEKQNIELVKDMKKKLLCEINSVKKAKKVIFTASQVVEKYGFEEIETPIFEFTEVKTHYNTCLEHFFEFFVHCSICLGMFRGVTF